MVRSLSLSHLVPTIGRSRTLKGLPVAGFPLFVSTAVSPDMWWLVLISSLRHLSSHLRALPYNCCQRFPGHQLWTLILSLLSSKRNICLTLVLSCSTCSTWHPRQTSPSTTEHRSTAVPSMGLHTRDCSMQSLVCRDYLHSSCKNKAKLACQLIIVVGQHTAT